MVPMQVKQVIDINCATALRSRVRRFDSPKEGAGQLDRPALLVRTGHVSLVG
jgi:hypothetical protein